jgi:hypothetical protein
MARERGQVLSSSSVHNFLAMNGNIPRRLDPDSDLTALNGQNRDRHRVANRERLTDPSSENQHAYGLIGRLELVQARYHPS